MKRVLYVVFLGITLSMFSCNILTAQINRTILGVKLGTTTKDDLPKILPKGYIKEHMPSGEKGYQTFDIDNVTFAGVKWDNVTFSWKDNKIVTYVCFKSSYLDRNAPRNRFNSIYLALGNKYKRYEKKALKSGFHFFTDNTVSIEIELEYFSCSLSYSFDTSLFTYQLLKELGYLKDEDIVESEL